MPMPARTDSRFLRDTPWFRELNPLILDDLLEHATPKTAVPGETLFSEGQAFLGEVYILHSGEIEVRRPTGRTEKPMPGYILGLSSYLADTPYPATAVAATEAKLFVVSGAALWALEHRHPPFFDALNRLIAQRLRERSVSQAPIAGALMQPVMATMGTPLISCPADSSLRAAYDLMKVRHMGSLPVCETDGTLLGLLTYPTLTARLIAGGVNPETEPVRTACRAAQTVGTSTPLWQVEQLMEQNGVKHLVVVDNNRPVGMISQTDLVQALTSRLGSMRATVATADSISKLAELYLRMGDTAAETLEANRQARTAVRIISEVHLAIQRRCIELTIQHMENEGWGPPPIEFAFIIMGSGGRKEMMLNPDQDNGLILADGKETASATVKSWFEAFSDRANSNLDAAGYVICPGDIMARNPLYHKPLSEWQAQFTKLTAHPTEKAARFSNIVFDFRTLYGDESLTLALRDHLRSQLLEKPRLLQYMVQDDAEGRPPLNLFNQLITQNEGGGEGKVDVKRNGLRIIADAARILALRAGIGNCNTNDRLNALVRQGELSSDFAGTVTAAYDELLDITLTHQLEQFGKGETPDKLVVPSKLSTSARESLRVAMRGVKRFQDLLNDKIGTIALPF
jgi:CBS domain-containing protein